MVALTMKTPVPGTLAYRPARLPARIERRRTRATDLTLYDERGLSLGRVRAVHGSPEFGPEAPEMFLHRDI